MSEINAENTVDHLSAYDVKSRVSSEAQESELRALIRRRKQKRDTGMSVSALEIKTSQNRYEKIKTDKGMLRITSLDPPEE